MSLPSFIESLETRRLLSANGLSAKGAKITAVEGQTPPAVFIVATLKDKTPEATSAYTATITWGDGSSSAGAVVANDTGGFNVEGSHTYVARGKYHTSIAVTETDGNAAHAASVAKVANAPITLVAKDISSVAVLAFQGVVATYTDADPRSAAGPVAGQTALIRWGDHITSVGTLALNSSTHKIEVSGKHAYSKAGTYMVAVLIREPTVPPTIATSTATVAVPSPTTSPSLVGDYVGTAKEGGGGGFLDDVIGDVIGDQPFELNTSGQTISGLTSILSVAGGASDSLSLTGQLLDNHRFSYTFSDAGGSITLSGRITPDGQTISGQIDVKYSGSFSLKFKGAFVAKKQ